MLKTPEQKLIAKVTNILHNNGDLYTDIRKLKVKGIKLNEYFNNRYCSLCTNV